MKIVIVSGGTPPPENLLYSHIKDANIIIGTDKGCDTLIKYNIAPKYIIGDFDSAKEDFEILIKKGAQKYNFPPEKDETDSNLAFNLAVNEGATHIVRTRNDRNKV